MVTKEKSILSRLYFVAACLFLFAILVVVKLVMIQINGEEYRQMAEESTIKNFVIQPNRGNLYSDDGSLLATSVTRYDIRFDAVTVSDKNFEANVKALAGSLSKLLGKPSSYYQNALRRARVNKNRYFLIARNLGYAEYMQIKKCLCLILVHIKEV